MALTQQDISNLFRNPLASVQPQHRFYLETENQLVTATAEIVRAYLNRGFTLTVNEQGYLVIGGKVTSHRAAAVQPVFRASASGIEVSDDKGITFTLLLSWQDMDMRLGMSDAIADEARLRHQADLALSDRIWQAEQAVVTLNDALSGKADKSVVEDILSALDDLLNGEGAMSSKIEAQVVKNTADIATLKSQSVDVEEIRALARDASQEASAADLRSERALAEAALASQSASSAQDSATTAMQIVNQIKALIDSLPSDTEGLDTQSILSAIASVSAASSSNKNEIEKLQTMHDNLIPEMVLTEEEWERLNANAAALTAFNATHEGWMISIMEDAEPTSVVRASIDASGTLTLGSDAVFDPATGTLTFGPSTTYSTSTGTLTL